MKTKIDDYLIKFKELRLQLINLLNQVKEEKNSDDLISNYRLYVKSFDDFKNLITDENFDPKNTSREIIFEIDDMINCIWNNRTSEVICREYLFLKESIIKK